jgi:hypothetical protein
MSKTTSYADLGKVPSDLIGKGFPAPSTFKVNHDATVPFGVNFKSAFTTKTDGSVKLVVEEDYKLTVSDVPVGIKGKWTSEEELEASVAVSNLITSGTEVKPWYKKGKNDEKVLETTGGVSVSYVNDKVNVVVKTDTLADYSRHKLDVAAVVQAPQNLYWGVNATYTHNALKKGEKPAEGDKVSPWLVQGRLHYVQPESSLTVAYEVDPQSKDKPKVPQLSLSWFQTVNPSLSVATSFVIPPGNKKPKCIVASDHKWDAQTSVKSKVTVGDDNRVAIALKQNLSQFAVATIGADLNANKLVGSSSGTDHSFGFELQLK